MIFDNENFTEEQKQIIAKIGKKHKENKSKNTKKLNMNALIIVLIFAGILVGLYLLDDGRIYTVVILALLGIVVGGLNYFKAKKNVNQILARSDYEVGLYYADKDNEVIGNSYKKFKQNKLGAISMTVLGFVMVIFMSLIFLNEAPVNYDNLTEMTGILDEGHFDSDEGMNLKLEGDTTIYRIQSIYTYALDIDRIFDEIKLGDEVIFLVSEVKNVNDDVIRDVYYYEVNSTEYMNYDLMMQGYERNHNLGLGAIYIFALISVVSIIAYFMSKYYYLPKNQHNEKYDLGIKTDPLEVVENKDIFSPNNKSEIATFAPKWMIILMFVFLTCFSVATILCLVLITDTTSKLISSIISGLFTIACVVGCYDGLNNNEIIKGDYFISHRFGKAKEIHIKEIKRASLMGQFVVLLDSNNNTLVRMDRGTGNLDKILERLTEYGVVIEVY
ncbi:hypothetical protein RJI07_03590 [Mycoplasmatota bacterium WC30]